MSLRCFQVRATRASSGSGHAQFWTNGWMVQMGETKNSKLQGNEAGVPLEPLPFGAVES